MSLLETFGPWVVVVVMSLAILKRVENKIWVHSSQVDLLVEQTSLLIEQYKERLAERDANIQRQHQLLLGTTRVADSSSDMAATLIRGQGEVGGE